MAILAECDICGNQHRVKDDLVGSSVRCKDCGVLFLVTPGPPITSENFVEEGGRLRRREQFRARSLPAHLVAGTITTLIVLLLASVVGVTVMMLKPRSQSATIVLRPIISGDGPSASCTPAKPSPQ